MRCLGAPGGRAATASACCSTSGRAAAVAARPVVAAAAAAVASTARAPQTQATWSRPTPDRDQDWIKPSYVPGPRTQPEFPSFRPDDPRPLYAPPAPEFSPAERPESPAFAPKEMPKMPERPRDPIPAGNPGGKERPPGEGETESLPAREEPAAPRAPPPVKKGT